MWIEPNTNIKILKNVPLDKTYNHTLFFNDDSEQNNYFSSLKKFDLNNQTYQRVQRGIARVNYKAEDLYDCNYLMFQNTSFGSKWFYAFITSVEYVNNIVSEIKFEIDVMQTWHFNYTLKECFVEREHSETDEIGDNIIDENLDIGEYVTDTPIGILANGVDDLYTIVAISDVEKVTVKKYAGIMSGLQLYAITTTQELKTLIDRYKENPESIISIYTVPKFAVNVTTLPDDNIPIVVDVKEPRIVGAPHFTSEGKPIYKMFGEHTPKNNKLYTYPYNFITITNNNGDSLNLKYEYFKDKFTNMGRYEIACTVTQPVTMCLKPLDYGQSHNVVDDLVSPQYTLTLANFPQCSWSSDSFIQWASTNGVSSAIKTVGSLASAVLFGKAKTIGAIAKAVGFAEVSNLLSGAYVASNQADVCRGSSSDSNVMAQFNKLGFSIMRTCINEQQARVIDEYFNMYGYATNRCKIPNISNRPHWNFIKTLGCVIKGSIPADDLERICGIYDKGITFWKNGGEVGNYSLDNSPTE